MIKLRKKAICVLFSLLLILAIFFSDSTRAQISSDQTQGEKTTQKTIDITLKKKNNLFKIIRSRVYWGDYYYLTSYEQWKGERFNGRVVSFRNDTLGYFPVDNNLVVSLCSDGVDESGNMTGGCRELSEGEVLIQMPYFPNGKYIEIYDLSGKKVLTIDLSSKATCNEDGKCDQPVEDSVNCPQDCKNNEPVVTVKPGEMAPSRTESFSKTETGSGTQKVGFPSWLIAILLLLLAVFLGAGYYIYKETRRE